MVGRDGVGIRGTRKTGALIENSMSYDLTIYLFYIIFFYL